MASMLGRLSVTLTDTNWARKDASDFTPISGAGWPSSGWRIATLEVVSVATNAASICMYERVGNADAGTRGQIVIPEAIEWAALAGSTLALGNLTLTFVNSGASTGNTIATTNKSRAAIVAEVVAKITSLATGILDLEAATGKEPGLIVLQSDTSDISVPTWTKGSKAAALRLVATGLLPATAQVISAGSTMAKRTFDAGDDVRGIAIRANAANSVLVLEATLVAAGPPVR